MKSSGLLPSSKLYAAEFDDVQIGKSPSMHDVCECLPLVPPKICIPNGYAYLHFDSETEAKKHYSHIMGDLVNFQNDVSRRGKSISEHQTYFLSHLDELSLTDEQKKTLEEYSGQFTREII